MSNAAAPPPDRWLSPPQIGRKLGVDPGKIIEWIRRGELRAVNIAENLGGRPRYRVDPAALAAFLDGRSTSPTPKPVRQRKKGFERKYYV